MLELDIGRHLEQLLQVLVSLLCVVFIAYLLVCLKQLTAVVGHENERANVPSHCEPLAVSHVGIAKGVFPELNPIVKDDWNRPIKTTSADFKMQILRQNLILFFFRE